MFVDIIHLKFEGISDLSSLTIFPVAFACDSIGFLRFGLAARVANSCIMPQQIIIM